MKLLTRVCRVARRIFSDGQLNRIMCGMALFPTCIWSLTAYLAFATQATQASAPFAVPLASLAALPWALLLAVLLKLSERSFEASTTGLSVGIQQQEGEPPL